MTQSKILMSVGDYRLSFSNGFASLQTEEDEVDELGSELEQGAKLRDDRCLQVIENAWKERGENSSVISTSSPKASI